MSKLVSRYSRVLKKMQEEGRVVTLTAEETFAIDHELAKGMTKIKQEYEIKSKNSWAAIKKLEATTVSARFKI